MCHKYENTTYYNDNYDCSINHDYIFYNYSDNDHVSNKNAKIVMIFN